MKRLSIHICAWILCNPLLFAQQPWEWCIGHQGFLEGIATDGDGYSYVVGVSDTSGFMGFPNPQGGGFLAKLSPSGSAIWSHFFTHASFDELLLKNDVLNAAGHGDRNVVVGNHSFNVDSTQHAYLVAAFDTAGNDIWVDCSRYTSDMSTGDMDVNQAGELFIAASGYSPIYTDTDTFSFTGFNRQILALKYTSTGALEWISQAGCALSKARAQGIACDASGSAYMTGVASTESPDCQVVQFGSLTMPYPSTFFLTKLNSSGDFVWLKHAFGAAGQDVEYLPNDSIAVIGHFGDSTNAVGPTTLISQHMNLFMGAFDLNGNPGWAYASQASNDSSYCDGIKLHRSASGQLFALSHAVNSVTLDGMTVNSVGHGLQVSKFSSGGTRYWTATMQNHPGTPNNYVEPQALSSDAGDRAYVSGYFNNADGPDPYLVWGPDSLPGSLGTYSMFAARTHEQFASIAERAFVDLRIHPNPTSGVLRLDDISQNVTIQFTDAIGQVFEPRRSGPNTYDLGSLPDGMYIVRVTDGLRFGTSRVILLR